MSKIEDTLKLIKEQTGLELKLCSYFTGLRKHNKKEYFNVELPKNTSESIEYKILKRYSEKYNIISVEPNGAKRLAIYINKKTT